MIPFATLASAVDRLNQAARAEPCVPTSWLYTLKDRTIELLDEAGLAGHRRIVVPIVCTNCGGSGRHRMGTPYEEACRRCFWGRGSSHSLHFVETVATLNGCRPIAWHSPATHGVGERLWNHLSHLGAGVAEEGAWRPRRPGVALAPEAMAELLLVVEGVLLSTLTEVPSVFYLHHLHLGHVAGCGVCAAPWAPFDWRMESEGRLAWSTGLCRVCDGSASTATRARARPAVAAHPAIQAWAACHPVYPAAELVRRAEDDIPF